MWSNKRENLSLAQNSKKRASCHVTAATSALASNRNLRGIATEKANVGLRPLKSEVLIGQDSIDNAVAEDFI
jgi:hypothetical protein